MFVWDHQNITMPDLLSDVGHFCVSGWFSDQLQQNIMTSLMTMGYIECFIVMTLH